MCCQIFTLPIRLTDCYVQYVYVCLFEIKSLEISAKEESTQSLWYCLDQLTSTCWKNLKCGFQTKRVDRDSAIKLSVKCKQGQADGGLIVCMWGGEEGTCEWVCTRKLSGAGALGAHIHRCQKLVRLCYCV